MKSYLTKPRVQQAIMKASRFGPVRRNILNQIIAQEADKEQQKRLWSLNTASQNYYRNKALKEQDKRFQMGYDQKEDMDDYMGDRSNWATGIAATDMAMRGGFGYNQMQRDKAVAEQDRVLGQNLLEALRRTK